MKESPRGFPVSYLGYYYLFFPDYCFLSDKNYY